MKLEFTGTIVDDGTIRLKVAPEVSSLDYAMRSSFRDSSCPPFQLGEQKPRSSSRMARASASPVCWIDRTTVQLSKIPGIGDIPILGELFKSRNESSEHGAARSGDSHDCGSGRRTTFPAGAAGQYASSRVLTWTSSKRVCRSPTKKPEAK